MLALLLLLAGQIPVLMCSSDPVCIAANEFRGRYSAWANVASNGIPGTLDVKEIQRWKQVELAWKRLRKTRGKL